MQEKVQQCGTSITCIAPKRFKCWDQTCRKDPRDCPPLITCVTPPIQCPDGSCVSSREQCHEILEKACEPSTPIKCPNLECVKDVGQCEVLMSNCPMGFVLCSDNTCRIHQNLCPKDRCPVIAAIKCPDGNCVTDKKYCDSLVGCPYDRPYRCPQNGQCVKEEENCKNIKFACDKDLILCKDGSCRGSVERCPNEQGCPLNKPQKCVNGNCIDPKQDECATSRCSIEYPI